MSVDVQNLEINTPYYFAYGSNMSSSRMFERVGEVEILGHYILRNYEFLYALLQPTSGFLEDHVGYATVKKKPEQIVHGVLYRFTSPETQIATLDDFEGTAEGYYKRIQIAVEPAIGVHTSRVNAHVYIGNICSEHYSPRDHYVNIVIQGARDHNLPEDYIKDTLTPLQPIIVNI